jgi:hypothetical protein
VIERIRDHGTVDEAISDASSWDRLPASDAHEMELFPADVQERGGTVVAT